MHRVGNRLVGLYAARFAVPVPSEGGVMKKIQQTRRREEEHFLLLCRKIPAGERWVDGW